MVKLAMACRWVLLLVALLTAVPAVSGTALGSSFDSNPLFGSKPAPAEAWLSAELRAPWVRPAELSFEGFDGDWPAAPGHERRTVSKSGSSTAVPAAVAAGVLRPLRTSPSAPRAPPRST